MSNALDLSNALGSKHTLAYDMTILKIAFKGKLSD